MKKLSGCGALAGMIYLGALIVILVVIGICWHIENDETERELVSYKSALYFNNRVYWGASAPRTPIFESLDSVGKIESTVPSWCLPEVNSQSNFGHIGCIISTSPDYPDYIFINHTCGVSEDRITGFKHH